MRPLAHAGVVAFAAVVLVACSSGTDSAPNSEPTTSAAPPSTATVTAAPPATVAAPPSTVTVTPPPPTGARPAPATGARPASGPFQSPSGNIRCTMFTSDGSNTARCEVVEHIWAAPPRLPNCQLNWGDRLELTEGSAAVFSCYGQDLPGPPDTLDYGQVVELGSISCSSESVGIMCIDNDTGHYFNISRDAYQLG